MIESSSHAARHTRFGRLLLGAAMLVGLSAGVHAQVVQVHCTVSAPAAISFSASSGLSSIPRPVQYISTGAVGAGSTKGATTFTMSCP